MTTQALISAADMEPTAADMEWARQDLAEACDFLDARDRRSGAMCHVEQLAEALAAGHVTGVAVRMRQLLAYERAFQERRAELRAAFAGASARQ